MYVTRPLSMYRKSPSEPTEIELEPEPEPEGPNTGVLVIEDKASESRWFLGLLKRKSVKVLPFPQNKIMELRYTTGCGQDQETDYFHAMLIPVLNQPLDSNQYYIIDSFGQTKGLAYTSSREDDIKSCCCYTFIYDTPPQLFDPRNVYQQFQINTHINCVGPRGFISTSMAPDGVPPYFLRHKRWKAYTKTLKNFEPTPALGLDAALRARLPAEVNSEPVVVGKWYCPFIFIREGDVDSQMKNSPYYEMTLQQNWEEVFGCYKLDGETVGNNSLVVDVCVPRQVVLVEGLAAERVEVANGVMWFGASGVGLNMAIVERVKWDEERVGFIWGKNEEQLEIVVTSEEFERVGEWKRFGCYVLVERFVLKRMDGTLVLTWDFRHTHQIRTKWE